MNIQQIADTLAEQIPASMIYMNEPMKNHTSFRVGGAADILLCPKTIEQLKYSISICKKDNIPYYIMGNGSNLLVKDGGFRGVVIQLFPNMNQIKIEGGKVYACAGILLSSLANECLKNKLTGLEFAHGIPGTLGGAVCMNAGAYGGEMKDVIESVQVLDADGNMHVLSNGELELGYRTSFIQTQGWTAVGATIRLKEGEANKIKNEMKELAKKRRDKQPLNMPSAGSTFKRPQGYFAGKLIMDANLRGYQIGGAKVSEKHCGFVVNTGNATTKDILALIQHIQNTVDQKFGVRLEPEVRIIGED